MSPCYGVVLYFNTFDLIQNPLAADEDDSAPASFPPVFCLRSEVDVSPMALTGMKQCGLCIINPTGFEFRSTDSYSTVDEKLRNLFPRLFDWICHSEPDTATTSSWLVCMKAPWKNNLVVYSDDAQLPSGLDIIASCQLSKSKSGMKDRVLYLGEPST